MHNIFESLSRYLNFLKYIMEATPYLELFSVETNLNGEKRKSFEPLNVHGV